MTESTNELLITATNIEYTDLKVSLFDNLMQYCFDDQDLNFETQPCLDEDLNDFSLWRNHEDLSNVLNYFNETNEIEQDNQAVNSITNSLVESPLRTNILQVNAMDQNNNIIVENKQKLPIPRIPVARKRNIKHDKYQYIKNFFSDTFGSDTKIHIKSYTTKSTLYRMLKNDATENNIQCMGMTTFKNLFHKVFPNVQFETSKQFKNKKNNIL